MKKYLKLTSLGVCVSQITSQIVDFFTSWLPVIIDYQLQEVYLNQSLLFTAFYDSLSKVKIYKQGADSQCRHETDHNRHAPITQSGGR